LGSQNKTKKSINNTKWKHSSSFENNKTVAKKNYTLTLGIKQNIIFFMKHDAMSQTSIPITLTINKQKDPIFSCIAMLFYDTILDHERNPTKHGNLGHLNAQQLPIHKCQSTSDYNCKNELTVEERQQ
jgi:hypothetical protein